MKSKSKKLKDCPVAKASVGCGVVYYDPSLTGKGKTYGLLSKLATSHGKTIIALPSLKLVNEYKDKISEVGRSSASKFRYQVISSDEKEKGCNKKTREMLQSSIDKVNSGKSQRKVVITTHSTLERAFQFGINGVSGWDLYIDEAMDLFKTTQYNLTELSAGLFLDNFQVESTQYNGLKSIKVAEGKESVVKSIVKEERLDSFWSTSNNLDFLRYIQSPSYTSYARMEDLDKARNISDKAYKSESGRMFVLSVINPSVLNDFASVTMLSALYRRTVMSQLLEILGFELREERLATRKGELHVNGSRLTIYYATERKNSKVLKSKRISSSPQDKTDAEDAIVKAFRGIMGTNNFIYNANVCCREKSVYTNSHVEYSDSNEESSQGVLLTAIAGVNEYDDYHHALYTTARNLDESESSVLNSFGIDVEFANNDRNFLTAYQFVSRTSIRNEYATDPVSFYVVDKGTAEFLKSLWPGSSIVKVPVQELNVKKDSLRSLFKDDEPSYNKYSRYNNLYQKKGRRKFRSDATKKLIYICEKYELYESDLYKHLKAEGENKRS